MFLVSCHCPAQISRDTKTSQTLDLSLRQIHKRTKISGTEHGPEIEGSAWCVPDPNDFGGDEDIGGSFAYLDPRPCLFDISERLIDKYICQAGKKAFWTETKTQNVVKSILLVKLLLQMLASCSLIKSWKPSPKIKYRHNCVSLASYLHRVLFWTLLCCVFLQHQKRLCWSPTT